MKWDIQQLNILNHSKHRQNCFQTSHPQMLNIDNTFHITYVFTCTVNCTKKVLPKAAKCYSWLHFYRINKTVFILLARCLSCTPYVSSHGSDCILTSLSCPQTYITFFYLSRQMKTSPVNFPSHTFTFSQCWRWRLSVVQYGTERWSQQTPLKGQSIFTTPRKIWTSVVPCMYLLCATKLSI